MFLKHHCNCGVRLNFNWARVKPGCLGSLAGSALAGVWPRLMVAAEVVMGGHKGIYFEHGVENSSNGCIWAVGEIIVI